MATWTVKTADKKSVTEIEIWTKSGQEIRRITGFRWGSWTVETDDDELPELEFEDGKIDINNCYSNNVDSVELISMEDGWLGDVEYPVDMSDQEQERLDELWDEDGYDGWENDGWYNSETEVWLEGPIEILDESGDVVKVVNN
jgi:hypothetical protein